MGASLPMCDFVMYFIGHLQNINWMSYAYIPNVDTFYYVTYKKITFVNITLHIVQRVFKYREAVKFMVADISFQI